MFNFQIITIFPERYHSFFQTGLFKKAIEKKILNYKVYQLLDYAIIKNKKKKIDDKPYGGGPGMVLRIEPVESCLNSLEFKFPVIAMTASGIPLNQRIIHYFYKRYFQNIDSEIKGLTLLSGYYEGFDQRILDNLVHYEISIGNFILNSGDSANLCFIDAFSRLLPDFLGKEESHTLESFQKENFLDSRTIEIVEHPHYTRPREYKGWKVPEILFTGDHKKIAIWREEKSLEKSLLRLHKQKEILQLGEYYDRENAKDESRN